VCYVEKTDVIWLLFNSINQQILQTINSQPQERISLRKARSRPRNSIDYKTLILGIPLSAAIQP
jgi:hypothetical protein